MSQRIRAIDWLRGLVIMLMTVDHVGNIVDAAHMHADKGSQWVRGTPLPAAEFLTRWITHLCAPTFVMLAGASLALSTAKRGDDAGQTRFLVTRGLLIAALDPIWMSLGFNGYQFAVSQVLYAIGLSMVCMAFLRKLSSTALIAIALAIQIFGELSAQWQPTGQPWHALWAYLWIGGKTIGESARCGYPLFPWLSIMIAGYLLGRWLMVPRPRRLQVQTLVAAGLALLVTFVIVRALDGYGNWGLHRDSLDILQWLHVNKYPPSITYTTLELGIALLLLAGFLAVDDPAAPRRALAVLSLFGATAFFYYLWHVHLAGLFQLVVGLDRKTDGLAKTWIGAALLLAVLAGPCWWYRRYKRAHPNSWTRYI